MATLRTPLLIDAPAGAHLRVAWTLTYLDENGRRRPFGAGGVFVRLRSASGAGAETGFASARSVAGRYAATVVVPKGGIGDVEIGLVSWSSGPAGTRTSDMLFPIANRSLIERMGYESPPDTGMRMWPFLVGPGVLAVLAAVLVLFRRRSGGSTSPSPV